MKVPVQVRYERIMKILEHKSDAMQKHKEELLGSATDFDTSDLYNILGLGKELVGSYELFKEMVEDPQRIRTAAKLIAQHQLQNMVELVRRHDSIIRRNEEKHKKPKPATKGKGKK